MDLSIVILNYKQKGLVKQCVKGIIAAQPQLTYEIIVVDNASHDGCSLMVNELLARYTVQEAGRLPLSPRRTLPSVVTIDAPRNGGFAYGNNLGMRRATGRYVLVVNPDIAIVAGSLECMVAAMDQDSRIGILGPKLLNPDGTLQYSCRRFPGWLMPVLRRTFFGKIPVAQHRLAGYLMTDWDHATSRTVDWLFGACLLFRREVLERVGFFDERFFMYFEDLDLCRRCWAAGLAVYYDTTVALVHYHQRSSAERGGIRGVLRRAGRTHLLSGLQYYAKYFRVPLPADFPLESQKNTLLD